MVKMHNRTQWHNRELQCTHKLGFYFETAVHTDGLDLLVFYCPFCMLEKIKIRDINMKKVVESYNART